MQFWNYCHDQLGVHLTDLVGALILVVMAVSYAIHRIKNKKKLKEYESELGQEKAELAGKTEKAAEA